MKVRQPLSIFFQEEDADRWLPFDRYPRSIIRFLVRGPRQPGGARRVFLNLTKGLELIGVPHRVNDFRYMRQHEEEPVCLIGQPQLLRSFRHHTPMFFGPALYNHPVDDEALPRRHAIRRIVVPSPWVKEMFSKVWPNLVSVWPVGIDVGAWSPAADTTRDIDVLVYEKLFRDRDRYRVELVEPMIAELRRQGLTVSYLRYGFYREPELHALARRVKSMIYLSPHETQGIACEQMMAAGVPVMAWDPGGDWQSLDYLLRGVRFGSVTSVPYWDDRCGVKFTNIADFREALARFWPGVQRGSFAPREMILDNGLTLETSAQAYVDLIDAYL